MSLLLTAALENARTIVAALIPDFVDGKLTRADHVHKLAALYRQHGVAGMFMRGVPEPAFIGMMQGAGAYAHGLAQLAEEDKVASWGGAFWDAVGGGYWDAARQISQLSRTSSHNAAWEHEDDFLFVTFIMTRYFMLPDPTDFDATSAHANKQRQMLDRWKVVLEGAADPGLDLCEGLLAGDSGAFRSALADLAAAREAELNKMVDEGSLREDDASWYIPFWGQGLGLLRLAERDGLETDQNVSMVPEILRGPNPLMYDPNAWRVLDYVPRRRA